jgi:hypothetical protein
MLTLFAKQNGLDYINSVLFPVFNQLSQSELCYEVDPLRTTDKSSISQNVENLKNLTKLFLDAILNSLQNLPQ